MAEGVRPALGLSVGATSLAAVTADHSLTRKPVLTLYRQRPPEVGVPSENPRLGEPGLVITDFVDRVGDRVGIVAADGSMHRSEALVADGLRALAYAVTGGTLPESTAVTHPAHWGPQAVDALGTALSRVAEWSNRARPVTMIPDAAATLFAVRANPGIPARGTVVVCDFGGSGTSITLMDAAGDYRPVAPTVRDHDFSGDLIDQALLSAVMANVPVTGSFDPSGTSAIGSLSRLRSGCRSAKEQLSSSTVTTLTDELPGVRGDIRLTRNELDDAIRDSLDNFVAVLDETLARNGIRDLVAVVSVGGGANIPAVTTTLSGHLRVPVVTMPRPQLTAAIGAALRAARGPGDTSPTVLHPATPQTSSAPLVPLVAQGEKAGNAEAPFSGAVSTAMPVLAWSEADDSRVMPGAGGQSESGGGSGYTSARPAVNFEQPPRPRSEKKEKNEPVIPWYRLPAVLVIGTAVAVLLVGIAVAIGLSSDGPAMTPAPSTTPASSAPAPQPAPGAGPAPESTVTAPSTTNPPPPATTDTPTTVPPATPQAPAAEAPVQQAPPVAPARPPLPAIPQIPAIPPIPRIPGISAPIPHFGGI